jgi:hypothetical protein
MVEQGYVVPARWWSPAIRTRIYMARWRHSGRRSCAPMPRASGQPELHGGRFRRSRRSCLRETFAGRGRKGRDHRVMRTVQQRRGAQSRSRIRRRRSSQPSDVSANDDCEHDYGMGRARRRFSFDETTVNYLRSRVPEFTNPKRPGTRGAKSRSGYTNADIESGGKIAANSGRSRRPVCDRA